MATLLPCPFCGGEAETHEVGFPYHYWDVWCDGECFDHFCEKHTEAEAIAAWNSRAERTCFADEVTHRDCKYSVNRGWRERTCKNNAPDYLDFLCSECGFVHYHSEANDTGEGNEWNYCPNCGARVTPKNSEITPKAVSE